MGDPIRLSKKYYTPRRPWDKARIVAENQLIETYGLMSKKEVWVAKTMLRKKRNSARALLAARPEQMEIGKKQLIDSLARQGILAKDANLDDVLALKVEDFLERRLQTIVFRKGLANTVKQARQFVVHGWIELDAKKINSPGYLVPKEDEEKIKYYKGLKPKVLDAKLESPELQKAALQKEAAHEDTTEETEKEAEEQLESEENLDEVVK